MRSFLNASLFRHISPYPLGVLRIALLLFLYASLPRQFLVLDWSAATPKEFMHPGTLLSVLQLPFPLPEPYAGVFETVTWYSCLLAMLGLWTRTSLALFSICYAYLMAVESAWGWHDHGPSLVVQLLFVLCVTPGTASLSLDRLLRRDESAHRSLLGKFVGAPVPRWGLQLVFLLVSLFYFTSGLSKLRHGGFEWLQGKTLGFYLSGSSLSTKFQQYGGRQEVPSEERWRDGFGLDYYLYGARPSWLGLKIAESPLLAAGAASSAVLLELSFPLILRGGWLRAIILLSAVAFHATVFLTMGIRFFSWIVIDIALLSTCFPRRARNAALPHEASDRSVP